MSKKLSLEISHTSLEYIFESDEYVVFDKHIKGKGIISFNSYFSIIDFTDKKNSFISNKGSVWKVLLINEGLYEFP